MVMTDESKANKTVHLFIATSSGENGGATDNDNKTISRAYAYAIYQGSSSVFEVNSGTVPGDIIIETSFSNETTEGVYYSGLDDAYERIENEFGREAFSSVEIWTRHENILGGNDVQGWKNKNLKQIYSNSFLKYPKEESNSDNTEKDFPVSKRLLDNLNSLAFQVVKVFTGSEISKKTTSGLKMR